MIVGEGPGRVEDRERLPFVGPSGQILTDALERPDPPLLRRDCYITNIIKRRIQDDEDPTPEEIAYFTPELLRELEEVDPDVVIAAGAFAARFFLGPDFNMEWQHGMPAWSHQYGVPVVPCYHPASALHDTEQMDAVYWDYARAGAFVRGVLGLHQPKPRVTQVLDADLLPTFLPQNSTLGIDTEDKVDGTPWCATVSWKDGSGCFIPGDDERSVKRLRVLLTDPTLAVYIHNTMHDLKPLRQMGVDVGRGLDWSHRGDYARVVDTMVLAFEQGKIHTQGLKTLAYRLLNIIMQEYMDIVGPVAQERAYWKLVKWAGHQWPVPEATPSYNPETGKLTWSRPWGLNTHFNRLLADFNPALRDYLYFKATKKRPTPPEVDFDYIPNPAVDLIKRWEKVDLFKREQVSAQYGTHRIDDTDLSHCDFTTAAHYACQDADVTRILGRDLEARHRILDLTEISEIDHGQIPMVERMQGNGMPSDPDHFRALSREMREHEATLIGVLETITGRELNPNSTDQVADLLFKEMKLEAIKTTRTGKLSTGKKALQHLRKTNPVVEWIMSSREHVKVSGFCESIVEYTRLMVDGEYRAFYELMVTRAKTGRLASKKFNALAIPVRTALGKRIRHGFKARPGRQLGTWDLNQIEMRVMAHRSQDPLMLEIYNRNPKRFAKWERDLHVETASKIWGCSLQDVKKDWRTAAKSTGFGIIMGITGVGLSDQMRLYGLNPEDWPEDRCDELIADWLRIYKGVNDYQQVKRAEARRTGEVRDLFDRRHRLPHATCPLSWIRGEAERQSHALDIQGSAQAIEKICMARIWRELLPELRWMGHCEPLLQVHDELVWEFDEDLGPVIDPLMLHYLTTTVSLSVPIEAGGAMGQSWGDLEK